MAMWLVENVSKLVGYGGEAGILAPAKPDGFTSPQEKRTRPSESPEERKGARVDVSPVSWDVSLVSSTMSSPSVMKFMSSVQSPAGRAEDCKHQFNDIVRNDKIVCMFCKSVADASCAECNGDACKACAGLLNHAGLSGKRCHSATPPRDEEGTHKDRRVVKGFGGDGVAGSDSDVSEPMTQPVMDSEARDAILLRCKEKLEMLARKYLAEVEEVLGSTRSVLAEGAVVFDDLDGATKAKMVDVAISQSAQVVTLLKAVRVSVGGISIFAGGIPKNSTDDDLRDVFPNGAHIKRSCGRGKFDFAEVCVRAEEVDQVMGQDLGVCGGKLRLAEWKVLVRGGRRGAVEVTHHVAGLQVPAHRAGDRHIRADAYDAARRGLHVGAGRQDGTRERDGMKLGSQEEVSTREKNSSVVLKNLQWGVREDFLRETFKEAISVKVLLGDDGRSRGMGFLDFKDVATATRVMEASRDMLLNGRAVIFAYSLRKMHQAGDRPRPRQAAAAGQELA